MLLGRIGLERFGFFLLLAVAPGTAAAQTPGVGGAPGSTLAPAAAPIATVPEPAGIVVEPRVGLHRGSTLTLRGSELATIKDRDLSLEIGSIVVEKRHVVEPQVLMPFVIPFAGANSPPLGLKRARLVVADPKQGGNENRDLGYLQLTHMDVTFEVLGIQPAVAYPKSNQYELTVTGRGFGEMGQDHSLFIDGREVTVCWSESATNHCGSQPAEDEGGKGAAPAAGVTGLRVSDRELRFGGLPSTSFGGRHRVQLRLGDGPLSPARDIVFSLLPSTVPKVIAFVATAFLFVVMILLVRLRSATTTVEGFKVGPFYSLFLDKETETYSLARLQFYAWTFVGVFSYVFLALARAFVQGNLELPDVPASLPGIIAISAGTSVASVGITSVRGPKGTGPVQPSFADFVSTGGLVVPERFQFLIWTMVAALGFLLIVVLSDPATISTVPPLPDGLLYLSGISAFGYLAGKMARKPGPVIESALLHTTTGAPLEIELIGRNLSPEATVTIGGIDVRKYLASKKHPNKRIAVTIPVVQAESSEGAVTAHLYLAELDPSWAPPEVVSDKGRKLSLNLTNPDGQSAETCLNISAKDDAQLRTRNQG